MATPPSFSRETSLGSLSPLRDRSLTRVLLFAAPRELVKVANVSWAFYALQEDEQLWRRIALDIHIDQEAKTARFTYHGSWKRTVLHPQRLPGDWSEQSLAHMDSAARSSTRPVWARVRRGEVQQWYDVRNEDIARWPCDTSGIDRRDKLSWQEFVTEYEMKNRPVVVSGMLEDWPATAKWTKERIAAEYGDVPLRTNGRATDGRRFRMRCFDYMAYAATCNAEKFLYIFDKKVFDHTPEVLQDYTVPPYFRQDFFELMDEDDRPDWRWLLIGPHGSGSPLHQDPHGTSAWNAVLEGTKRVTFYPPEVIPPGVDEELIDSDYYASDDMMDWYRNTYPTLRPEQKPMECLVGPGEMIFIPSGWWHQVLNIGTTVAVTQNFVSAQNFPRVAAEINRSGSRSLRRDFKCALAESPHRALADHIIVHKNRRQ